MTDVIKEYINPTVNYIEINFLPMSIGFGIGGATTLIGQKLISALTAAAPVESALVALVAPAAAANSASSLANTAVAPDAAVNSAASVAEATGTAAAAANSVIYNSISSSASAASKFASSALGFIKSASISTVFLGEVAGSLAAGVYLKEINTNSYEIHKIAAIGVSTGIISSLVIPSMGIMTSTLMAVGIAGTAYKFNDIMTYARSNNIPMFELEAAAAGVVVGLTGYAAGGFPGALMSITACAGAFELGAEHSNELLDIAAKHSIVGHVTEILHDYIG